MRNALLLAALLAGCRAPGLDGAPSRALRSEIRERAGAREGALHRCLFVFNHSGKTIALFVGGRHVGWIGPRSSAAFFVGRSAGARTRLLATCPQGRWEATVEGPVWDLAWHLHA